MAYDNKLIRICINFDKGITQMNDPYLILLMIATGAFIGVFMLGLHNIFDGVAHKCWHDWSEWGYDETPDVLTQVRRCKKCGYCQMEQHVKLKGHTNEL